MTKRTKRFLIYILSGCVILYLLLHFIFTNKGNPQNQVEVTVAAVTQKDVNVKFRNLGTVQVYSTVDVKSMVTGPLLSTSFHEGDVVEKGQILFTIDPRSFIAAVDQAKANLARDKATLANNTLQVSRNSKLLKKGYIAKQDFDTLNATMKSATATVQADEAALENAQLQLTYATIHAPIPGKTGNILLKPGSIIKANDTSALVTINQINPIYVVFALPQNRLPGMQKSLQQGIVDVQAMLIDGSVETGKVTFIDNTVDPTTGTIQLKATFANAARKLWPGQFVTVEVPIEHIEHAILIPSQALLTGQNGFYVYVVDNDNVVQMRSVTPGEVVGEETIITQGLKVNEKVVIAGQLRIKEGMNVIVNNQQKSS